MNFNNRLLLFSIFAAGMFGEFNQKSESSNMQYSEEYKKEVMKNDFKLSKKQRKKLGLKKGVKL